MCIRDSSYAAYTTEGDNIGPMRRETFEDWRVYREWFTDSPDMHANYAHVRKIADQATGPLRSVLARVLKAQGAAYTVRDLEQGQLDRRRLWKVGLAQRTQTRPRLRKQTFVASTHNVAVLVAINESLSMGVYEGCAGTPARTTRDAGRLTRMDMAAASGLALGDVLHALQIPFGIFGHTTGNAKGNLREGVARCRVHVNHMQKSGQDTLLFTRYGDLRIEWVKQFRDPWLTRRPYMGGLYFQANTYDGEAVHYATEMLLKQLDVNRRILVMLDDGAPCPDVKLHNVFQDSHQENLRRQVRRAESLGVEVLGIGMACDVSAFYKHHVSVRDVSQLPDVLLRHMGRMLGVQS